MSHVPVYTGQQGMLFGPLNIYRASPFVYSRHFEHPSFSLVLVAASSTTGHAPCAVHATGTVRALLRHPLPHSYGLLSSLPALCAQQRTVQPPVLLALASCPFGTWPPAAGLQCCVLLFDWMTVVCKANCTIGDPIWRHLRENKRAAQSAAMYGRFDCGRVCR